MAIKLKKTLDSGFEAEYWRIVYIQADADDKNVNGRVVVYKNKEARLNGAKPVGESILFNFSVDSITGNLVLLAYNYLKTNILEGGEDE